MSDVSYGAAEVLRSAIVGQFEHRKGYHSAQSQHLLITGRLAIGDLHEATQFRLGVESVPTCEGVGEDYVSVFLKAATTENSSEDHWQFRDTGPHNYGVDFSRMGEFLFSTTTSYIVNTAQVSDRPDMPPLSTIDVATFSMMGILEKIPMRPDIDEFMEAWEKKHGQEALENLDIREWLELVTGDPKTAEDFYLQIYGDRAIDSLNTVLNPLSDDEVIAVAGLIRNLYD